jgi:hypothetical protein
MQVPLLLILLRGYACFVKKPNQAKMHRMDTARLTAREGTQITKTGYHHASCHSYLNIG